MQSFPSHLENMTTTAIKWRAQFCECTGWRRFTTHDNGDHKADSSPLGLGDVVRVRGSLAVYQGATEVKVVAAHALRDPNAEPLHWLSCAHLAATVYHRPLARDAATDRAVRRRGLDVAECSCGGPQGCPPVLRRLHTCPCSLTPDPRRDPRLEFRLALLEHFAASAAASTAASHAALLAVSHGAAATNSRVFSFAEVVAACGGGDPAAAVPSLAEVALRVALHGSDAPGGAAAGLAQAPGQPPQRERRQRVVQLLKMTLMHLRKDGLLDHDPDTDCDAFLDSDGFLTPLLTRALSIADAASSGAPPMTIDQVPTVTSHVARKSTILITPYPLDN